MPTHTARGSALVELVVSMPVLLLVLFGAIDFGRVFHLSMELANAARVGAQYGAENTAHTIAQVEASAMAASPGSAPYTATAVQACGCMDNAGAFTAQVCTSTCGSGRHLVVYTTVQVQKTFQLAAGFPGLPTLTPITRTATMRAQ